MENETKVRENLAKIAAYQKEIKNIEKNISDEKARVKYLKGKIEVLETANYNDLNIVVP